MVVNFCGAFARCEVMMDGLLNAWDEIEPDLPVFFSIAGTGDEEAIKMLKERLGMDPYPDMDAACKQREWKKNPALFGAALLYLAHTRRGKSLTVMMPYSQRLPSSSASSRVFTRVTDSTGPKTSSLAIAMSGRFAAAKALRVKPAPDSAIKLAPAAPLPIKPLRERLLIALFSFHTAI